MKPTANVGTSAVSHLAARPSRDTVVAAYQAMTREWWGDAADRFDPVASAPVSAEAGSGDPKAASARLEALEAVALLDATPDASQPARILLDFGAVPGQAADDSADIAVAVPNGVDFPVIWSFWHIANAAMRSRIERACRRAGYGLPVICTPNELMETDLADNAENATS